MIWCKPGIALRISVLFLLSLLTACGSDSDGGDTPGTPAPTPLPTAPDDGTTPPLDISGVPASGIRPGEPYAFRPRAAGSGLVFSINHKPAWAQFDPTTGELRGTPSGRDMGVTDDIVISVSDGARAGQLPPFSITVDTSFTGAIELSWQPPVQNEDGTELLDLAGYRIYLGIERDAYTEVIDVAGPETTSYTIDDLPPNTYYLAATAYDYSGVESGRSNVIRRRVD